MGTTNKNHVVALLNKNHVVVLQIKNHVVALLKKKTCMLRHYKLKTV